MVGGGGVLTCYLVPLILLLISFTHPSPPTPSPPNSPLVGCVAFVRLRACSGQETRSVDLSRLARVAEFQTPTIFDRAFDFHRSRFYRPRKIIKIIIYILYIYKNVSTFFI